MWPSCAHILKPLTDHSGLKNQAPIPSTLDMQTSFNKICVLMVADALAAYLDHNKRFAIKVTAKLYGVEEGNAIHCSYNQQVLKYASCF
ncbi:hypothetical protein ACHAW6_000296 [Cyclotella cf. meneghiniana]